MSKAAFIGVGVGLLLLLTPGLHILTGLFSPLVAGIVGAMQLKATWRVPISRVAGMAVIITCALTLAAVAMVVIVVAIVAAIGGEPPQLGPRHLPIFAAGVAAYSFAFAFLGGLIGSSFRK